VGMKFCGHVPNSLMNKNLGSADPYLLSKMVFWAPKTLLYPSGRGEKNFSSNFGRYDLQNGEE
jgi:hypothetical protein